MLKSVYSPGALDLTLSQGINPTKLVIKDPYENPKDLWGSQKVPLSLIPASAKVHEAMAFREGAKKYGAYNWREKRVVSSIYLDAAMRHIEAYNDGEDYDPESGVHNLGHARACLGILLDAAEAGNLSDDRPEALPVRKLFERVCSTKDPEAILSR